MARHVLGVRRVRRQRIVDPGRGQSFVGMRRIVVAMNQIMRDARMLREFLEKRFEARTGSLILPDVSSAMTSTKRCEGREGLRFHIVRIGLG